MKFLSQPQGVRFSNQRMIMFMMPIFIEQLMLAVLNAADTFMVSAKLGTTALAGVALVNRLDNFAKQFFIAISQGGSVVLAQYIGAQHEENSQKSLKNNIQLVVAIGIIFTLAMVLFKKQFLNLFFKTVYFNYSPIFSATLLRATANPRTKPESVPASML